MYNFDLNLELEKTFNADEGLIEIILIFGT